MTKEIRRAMNRSGMVPCDVCGLKTVLVEHHIRGRDVPNPEHPSNLANICPNDHALVHMGKVIIERWVATTNGTVLSWHRRGEPGIVGEDSVPYQIGEKR